MSPNGQIPLKTPLPYIYYKKGQEVPLRWQKRPKRESPTMLSNRMTRGGHSQKGNDIKSSMACHEGMCPSTNEGIITEKKYLRHIGATDEKENNVPFPSLHVD